MYNGYVESDTAVNKRRALQIETAQIIESIKQFFTSAAWQAWLANIPASTIGRYEYARAEWQIIHDEFSLDEPPYLTEAEQQAAEIATYDWVKDAPEFGSAEWFAGIDPIEF